MLARMWRNGSPCILLAGMYIGSAIMGVWKFLKKLKMEIPCDLTILFLGTVEKENTPQMEMLNARSGHQIGA